ncbi:MAG: glycosyltransferase family 39 protein [bacterium]
MEIKDLFGNVFAKTKPNYIKFLFIILLAGLFAHKYYNGMILDGILYSAIAKTMASTNNFLIPSFSNFYPVFFDHPPLFFWITALLFKVFGTTSFVARLFPMLCSAGLLILIYRFIKKHINETAAYFSVLILVLNGMYLKYSSSPMIDLPLLLIVISYYMLFVSSIVKKEYSSQVWLGVLLGLGLLLKGPIVLGILFASVFYALISKNKEAVLNRFFIYHLVIGFVIPFVWIIPLAYKHWDLFYNTYLMGQLKASVSGQRGDAQRTPIGFTLFLLQTMTIWAIPFIYGVYRFFKDRDKNHIVYFAFICFLFFFCPLAFLKIRKTPQLLIYSLPFFSVIAAYGVNKLISEKVGNVIINFCYYSLGVYLIVLLLFPIQIRSWRDKEIFYFGDLIKQTSTGTFDYYLYDNTAYNSMYQYYFHPNNYFYYDVMSYTANGSEIRALFAKPKPVFVNIYSAQMSEFQSKLAGLPYYPMASCHGFVLVSNQFIINKALTCY